MATASVTGLTAEKITELVNARVAASSKVLAKTVPGLATGEGAFGSLSLGKAYRLMKLVSTGPCRLRLYASPEQRAADGDRSRDLDPQGDHGLILEAIMTTQLLSLILLPAPHGYTEAVSGATYFSIVNDGAPGDITFTFTEQVLEN